MKLRSLLVNKRFRMPYNNDPLYLVYIYIYNYVYSSPFPFYVRYRVCNPFNFYLCTRQTTRGGWLWQQTAYNDAWSARKCSPTEITWNDRSAYLLLVFLFFCLCIAGCEKKNNSYNGQKEWEWNRNRGREIWRDNYSHDSRRCSSPVSLNRNVRFERKRFVYAACQPSASIVSHNHSKYFIWRSSSSYTNRKCSSPTIASTSKHFRFGFSIVLIRYFSSFHSEYSLRAVDKNLRYF